MQMRVAGLVALASTCGSLAIACGPSKVLVAPHEVARIDVRPASGQGLFCPGDPFQVELLVRTKDGATCSSTDRKLGCRDKSDAVLDPEIVRLEVTPAMPFGDHDFTFQPDPNPLATAATGLKLRGWIEANGGKSMEAENTLKPVYSCLGEIVVIDDGPLGFGQHGRHGPEIHVAVTPLSTPWYANAALIRIDAPGLGFRRYAVSPSADRPVTIVSRGQDGAPGEHGRAGENGKQGTAATGACGEGGRGTDGQPGSPGGPGGDGGAGGPIQVVFDDAAADKLQARVHVLSVGGGGGVGGAGGIGGQGGAGGAAGPSGKGCFGKTGPRGAKGADGPRGANGSPGPNGPPPTFAMAPRATLFAAELAAITTIEATPHAR